MRSLTPSIVLVVAVAGCNAIFGVDGLRADENVAAGGGGSSTVAVGAAGGASSCTPGESRSCYDGPEGSEGIGTCAAGTARCDASGEVFGACEGAVLPSVEDCNTTEDESCDGYGRCGEVVWAHAYGGNGDDAAYEVAVTPAGHAWVGSSTTGNYQLDGESYAGVFLDSYAHQLDPSGAVSASVHITGINEQILGGLAVLGDDLVLTGRHRSALSIGGEDYPVIGNYDGFVGRIGPSGTQWVETLGGTQDDLFGGLAIDSQGMTVVGHFTGVADFGGGPRGVGDNQACVAVRLDLAGAYQWDVVFDGFQCQLTSVAVGANGHSYVGGHFFGNVVVGGEPISGNFSRQGLLVSLDPAGNVVEHRVFEAGDAVIHDLEVDGANVLVSGSFQGGADFGGGAVVAQARDGFTARYSADLATLDLLLTAQDQGDGEARGVSIAPNGDLLIAGAFEGVLTLAGATLAGQGDQDAFVVRLSSDGALRWARSFGGAKAQTAHRVSAFPDGAVIAVGSFLEEIVLDQPYASRDGDSSDAWIAKLSP